jgi:hypothetical protein
MRRRMKHEARGKETGRRTGLPVLRLTLFASRFGCVPSVEEMHK